MVTRSSANIAHMVSDFLMSRRPTPKPRCFVCDAACARSDLASLDMRIDTHTEALALFAALSALGLVAIVRDLCAPHHDVLSGGLVAIALAEENREGDLEMPRDALAKARHGVLDELCAAYLAANTGTLPSTTTMMQLLEWSHAQLELPGTERIQ